MINVKKKKKSNHENCFYFFVVGSCYIKGTSFDVFNVDSSYVFSSKRAEVTRRTWTKRKMDIIFTKFHRHIIDQTLPGKIECTRMLHEHKELKCRLWTHLKDLARENKMQ